MYLVQYHSEITQWKRILWWVPERAPERLMRTSGMRSWKFLIVQGIAELANGSEKSRYTFLEISDPATLLIKGECWTNPF